jgi:succinyl-CoA synthetase beta subunit
MCQQISEPGITSLMSSIQKIENLAALFLSFFCCYRIDDKTVNEIALALKNMKGLNCLVLDLGGPRINNGQAVLEEATGHIVNKRIRTGRVW